LRFLAFAKNIANHQFARQANTQKTVSNTADTNVSHPDTIVPSMSRVFWHLVANGDESQCERSEAKPYASFAARDAGGIALATRVNVWNDLHKVSERAEHAI